MAARRTRNSFRRAASHVKVTDGRSRAEAGGSAVHGRAREAMGRSTTAPPVGVQTIEPAMA